MTCYNPFDKALVLLLFSLVSIFSIFKNEKVRWEGSQRSFQVYKPMKSFQPVAITVKESTLNEGGNLRICKYAKIAENYNHLQLRAAETGLCCAGTAPTWSSPGYWFHLCLLFVLPGFKHVVFKSINHPGRGVTQIYALPSGYMNEQKKRMSNREHHRTAKQNEFQTQFSFNTY